jgi:hypothetical protein
MVLKRAHREADVEELAQGSAETGVKGSRIKLFRGEIEFVDLIQAGNFIHPVALTQVVSSPICRQKGRPIPKSLE